MGENPPKLARSFKTFVKKKNDQLLFTAFSAILKSSINEINETDIYLAWAYAQRRFVERENSTDQKISVECADQKISVECADQKISAECTDQKISAECTDQKISAECTVQKISAECTNQKVGLHNEKQREWPSSLINVFTSICYCRGFLWKHLYCGLYNDHSKKE